MIFSSLLNRLLNSFMIIALSMMPVSCGMVEKRIDRTTGGPNLEADTAVYLKPDAGGESKNRIPTPVTQGPLKITTTDAILLSLDNNLSLVVEKLNPSIQKTFVDTERAVFDPETNAEIIAGRVRGERLARAGSATESFKSNNVDGLISLKQFFPTGTTVSLEGTTEMDNSSLYRDAFYWTRLGMSLNQALLRGYGTEVNLVRLRQARLETRMSEYELRGFAQALVAEVEQTYWDYALARRQVEIFEESLKVARQQLDETQALIEVGRLARSELPAVQAELAAQEQGLIDARSDRDSVRLRLLRLLNPPGSDPFSRELDLIYQPTLPDIKLEDVESYVKVSSRMRPILNETRLRLMRDDLELIKTKNGLLPLLDLFITLGKSGYSSSFGNSFRNMDGNNYDASAGLRFQYPVFNREAKSLQRRALLRRDQTDKALQNLSQLVEVDVRNAYIQVTRTKQQIAASTATRIFDEETLRAETEKLRVGKSTSLLVAQAQHNLLVSRIAEVEALANYIKALINLYLQDGSLLDRRGVAAPGNEPVKLSSH